MGQAPADSHPPLSKTKVAKAVVEDRKANPPSAVDGLGGIEKRVGSRGKKKKVKKKVKEKENV